MNTLGNLYARGLGVGQDYKKAVYWWGRVLRDGNAEAMYHYGNAYAEVLGVRPDLWEARNWWDSSAEKGCAAQKKISG